jgi:hypothetical protein
MVGSALKNTTTRSYLADEVRNAVNTDSPFTVTMPSGPKLAIGKFKTQSGVPYIEVYCLEQDEAGDAVYSQQAFCEDRIEKAIACFLRRLKYGYEADGTKSSPDFVKTQVYCENGFDDQPLEIIEVVYTGILFFKNHYTYLDAILEPFWLEVFKKTPSETWSAGIVAAHGDKAYGYRREWQQAGINHNRGTLLFLLTYTSEFKGGKSDSCEWVIENYPKYLPMIEQAEAKVLQKLRSPEIIYN